MSSNVRARAFQSSMLGTLVFCSIEPFSRLAVHNITIRSESAYGSARSSAAFTTLNMAVLAPIASASDAMMTPVTTGLCRRLRTAYCTS